MKRNIVIINGPNLNLLGEREPEIYGRETLEDVERIIRESVPSDCELIFLQSNHEGEIIDWLHQYGMQEEVAGIVMNPGAFAHYSYAIADAVTSIRRPVIEVHLSDIYRRKEEWRRRSVTAPGCLGMISGLGVKGYVKAILELLGE